MTTVDLQPITLREATLTVGADDFTAAVDRVTFTPDVQWEWSETLRSGPTPQYKGVRWTCTVGFAQDLTAGSLTRYLLEHAAERRTVVFTPRAGTGTAVTADVMVVPGRLGGGTDGPLVSEAALPLFGAPAPAAVGA